MASRKGSTPRKRASKKAAAKDAVELKNYTEVAASSPLGKAIAKVGHMKGGGPQAEVYFGLTEKGGKPVYAIKKTGDRTGSGGSGTRHLCTLHTVNDDGELSEPLARVRSVNAGWVTA